MKVLAICKMLRVYVDVSCCRCRPANPVKLNTSGFAGHLTASSCVELQHRKRLQPFMSFLKEIGIAEPAQTVLQRPTLLGLDADKNLRAIVGYLQDNGHSAEDIAHMLQKSI